MNDIQERKAALLIELKELGIKSVAIEYSGSGDSGQIDSICAFTGADDEDQWGSDVDSIVEAKLGADQIPIRVAGVMLGEKDEKLGARLEQFAYDVLEVSNLGDWCNNDGGGGSMTILVEAGPDSDDIEHDAGTISIQHYTNRTERDYESATL